MAGEINSGGFGTKNDVRRTKYTSIDTNDSTSSRYSVDSQKPIMGPPPGIYVFTVPKDEIYRVPPPENAERYKDLSKKKPNRSNCRRCFWSFFAAVFILLVLALLIFGTLYVVYRPHKPRFSVSKISVTGINLTSPSPVSPVIKIKVRSQNVNGKLGLIYGKGNAAEVFYHRIKLGNGEFTAFEQPADNVTVMVTALSGSGIQLTSSSRKELTESQKKRKVPLVLRVQAPVKFKVGAVTTWTMTVTMDCKITVDKLTASATVVTENCDTGFSLL